MVACERKGEPVRSCAASRRACYDLHVKVRRNGELRGTPNVRVMGSSGEQLGVMTLAEALRLAMKEGLDLVEVVPNANPPVCKLLDFSKYK